MNLFIVTRKPQLKNWYFHIFSTKLIELKKRKKEHFSREITSLSKLILCIWYFNILFYCRKDFDIHIFICVCSSFFFFFFSIYIFQSIYNCYVLWQLQHTRNHICSFCWWYRSYNFMKHFFFCKRMTPRWLV